MALTGRMAACILAVACWFLASKGIKAAVQLFKEEWGPDATPPIKQPKTCIKRALIRFKETGSIKYNPNPGTACLRTCWPDSLQCLAAPDHAPLGQCNTACRRTGKRVLAVHRSRSGTACWQDNSAAAADRGQLLAHSTPQLRPAARASAHLAAATSAACSTGGSVAACSSTMASSCPDAGHADWLLRLRYPAVLAGITSKCVYHALLTDSAAGKCRSSELDRRLNGRCASKVCRGSFAGSHTEEHITRSMQSFLTCPTVQPPVPWSSQSRMAALQQSLGDACWTEIKPCPTLDCALAAAMML